MPFDQREYLKQLAKQRQRLVLEQPIKPIGPLVCPNCGHTGGPEEFTPEVQSVTGNPYND